MIGLTKPFIWLSAVLLIALLQASAQHQYDPTSPGTMLNLSLSPGPNDSATDEAISEKYLPTKISEIHFSNDSDIIDAIMDNSSGPHNSTKQVDYANSSWDGETLSIKPSIPDLTDEKIVENLSQNLSDARLNEALSPSPFNQSNRSRIAVHNGERIQAAIDSADTGGVVEIGSGIYYENLHIDKEVTILGNDTGQGQPIVDANGRGNAIEIASDQVILDGIIVTNSSNSSLKRGAGIRFSDSNNCTVTRITSLNNYYGICLVDSDNNTINDSNISNCQYGIRLYFANNNTLEQNIIRKTIIPMEVVSSKGNCIQENTLNENFHTLKTITENYIINNSDSFRYEGNITKGFVELNAKPGVQPSKSNVVKQSSHKNHDDDYDYDNSEGHSSAEPDNDDYNDLARKAAGTIIFNPPKSMTIGIGEWIDARIGQENTSSLVQGLLGKGQVQFRDINTIANMTYIVKLEGDSGFKIEAKRPDAQILGADPAVWLWMVTPLEGGNHTLILSVDIQLEKPPFNCRCVNVTYWPVSVEVLEPELEQKAMSIAQSSYTMIEGAIAFLASVISLILLFWQMKKGKNG